MSSAFAIVTIYNYFRKNIRKYTAQDKRKYTVYWKRRRRFWEDKFLFDILKALKLLIKMDGMKALSIYLPRLSIKGTTLNDAKIFVQTYSVLLIAGTTELLGYVGTFLTCVTIIVLYHTLTIVIVSCYFCKTIVEMVLASKNILTKSIAFDSITNFNGVFISDLLNTKTRLLTLMSLAILFVSLKFFSCKGVFTNHHDSHIFDAANFTRLLVEDDVNIYWLVKSHGDCDSFLS